MRQLLSGMLLNAKRAIARLFHLTGCDALEAKVLAVAVCPMAGLPEASTTFTAEVEACRLRHLPAILIAGNGSTAGPAAHAALTAYLALAVAHEAPEHVLGWGLVRAQIPTAKHT